jgi:nucleoside-diphosphate-sugar epimerase
VLNRLLDHEPILLPGDGKALQQFVTSTQMAYAIVAALETFDDGGWRAFNVASPGYASLEGFVQVCADIAGAEPIIRHVGNGPTGTGAVAFAMANPLVPFPYESYLLETSALKKAGLAAPAVTLDTMIEASLAALLASPERRWSRSAAEVSALD